VLLSLGKMLQASGRGMGDEHQAILDRLEKAKRRYSGRGRLPGLVDSV
jgi:hypothetical protein